MKDLFFATALTTSSLLVGLVGGCNDEGTAVAPVDGADGGAADSAATDSNVPGPKAKAGGLAYRDGDLRRAFLGGEVRIAMATDESDIVEYKVYFGSSAAKKLIGNPLGVVPARGVDLALAVAKDTPMPDGATHLLVYTVNDDGENPSPVAAPLRDNAVESRALTAGAASVVLATPILALDAKNKRVIVGGKTDRSALALVVCNEGLDDCVARDASLGTTQTAGNLSLFVDAAAERLIAISTESGTTLKNRYLACALDGTSCATKDISTGRTGQSAAHAVLDSASRRIYVVSTDGPAGRPILTRCEADGTGCISKDLSPDVDNAGYNPSVMVDGAGKQLLVVAKDNASSRVHLYRCDLDGERCTMTDAGAQQPAYSGDSPRAVFDEATGQVLTIAQNSADAAEKPSLFRCDVKTALCTFTDVSAGEPNGSHPDRASVVLSPETGSFFFTTFDRTTARLSLFRCKTDGTDCSHTFLSPDGRYGPNHGLIVDRVNDRVIVVADKQTFQGERTTMLFTFRPW